MSYAEQIAAFEASRAAKAAKMKTLMDAAGEKGETLDAEGQEEFDDLEKEVAAIDKHIDRLKKTQAMDAATARPVDGTKSAAGTESRAPSTVATAKVEEKLEKGIGFARYAMCLFAAKGDEQKAFRLAETHYPNHDGLVKTLKAQADGVNFGQMMKAAVEAGTTLGATWAAPLVEYQNFAGDFVEFLRPRTLIGQFGTGSIPSLNRIPFNVRIAGKTSGGNAYWVGEGAPKPLTAFDFNATELRWSKVATIAVLTEELIRFSDPSAERLVRDGLAAAVIERLDIDFVDPTKAAVTNVSPASITNGVTPIASSGSDADAVRRDVQALWAPFITARNPPRQAVYMMDSTTALALSLMQNPLGQSEFPGLNLNGGTFMGVPVLVSDYMPAGVVVLANASDIWLADDGGVTIDASREASLQMLDNPTNNSATGTATAMVSMFQTNSVAFRAERYINWAKRRASAVSMLSGVAWGQDSGS